MALYFWGRPVARATRLLTQARTAQAAGEVQEAEQLAVQALKLDPALSEAALLAADCALTLRKFERAVRYLQSASTTDISARLAAALKIADLNHHRLYRLADAERAYRAALELDPENVPANTGLAQLLSLCGRQREAAPYVLQLVRQGVDTDLLVLLAMVDGVINDLVALESARIADPTDPNPSVGLAWHAARAERTDEAMQLINDALLQQPDHAAAHILRGQLLLASGRTEEFPRWAEHLPQTANEFGDTWLVRAQMAEQEGDLSGAIRCYWESVRRAPESKAATFRLAHLLGATGASEAAEAFRDQGHRLHELEETQHRVLFASDHGRPELILPLARSCESAGRIWEAYGWCRFAVELGGASAESRQYLEHLQRQVEGKPLQLVADEANVALTIDLSHYPLPKFHSSSVVTVAENSAASTRLSFRNDAEATGLRFRYFNGTRGTPTKRMFEFTGGGIGVLDFDLDGFADLLFTQGRNWPPGSPEDAHCDHLFRNREGIRFEDVTDRAGIDESRFGQGVAVGDYDSDGFPDVYVANIGSNTLWLNHGDGTFTDITSAAALRSNEWTTSTVLVDLSGDGLPDIYDVNYVMASDVFDRVCRHPDGSPKMCMPYDFEAQPDRIWLNSGNGQFVDATVDVVDETPSGKGLGIAVWDSEGTGRLSLFVANDTTPSFFFVPETGIGGLVRLRECGIEVGLALNGEGKPTGCMGVALGDVDDDGRLDVHITNFSAEPNTLFLSSSAGFFADRTRSVGLYSPSLNMLGFGTQFLDMDLDGRLELFVSNGHVDDLSQLGRPYRMPPQLYIQDFTHRFAEAPAAQLGSYFQQSWLGRATARLDWNRDGRDDLAVGHLDDESALLTNTTRDSGRFLSLRLFGVQSNRDAIGTTVRARIGTHTFVRQLTAGDGYQASNERRLIFGAASAESVDELVVRWPSGIVQRFDNIAVPQELWLREGQPPLPAAQIE